jgi:hypothetical protein
MAPLEALSNVSEEIVSHGMTSPYSFFLILEVKFDLQSLAFNGVGGQLSPVTENVIPRLFATSDSNTALTPSFPILEPK